MGEITAAEAVIILITTPVAALASAIFYKFYSMAVAVALGVGVGLVLMLIFHALFI